MDNFALNCLLLQPLRMSKSTQEPWLFQQGTAVGERGQLPYPVRDKSPYVCINLSCHTSDSSQTGLWRTGFAFVLNNILMSRKLNQSQEHIMTSQLTTSIFGVRCIPCTKLKLRGDKSSPPDMVKTFLGLIKWGLWDKFILTGVVGLYKL